MAKLIGIDAFLMKPVVKLEMAGTVRKVGSTRINVKTPFLGKHA